MNKNAIKKFAIEARKKLIASVTDKAGMLGITAEGVSAPTTKGNDFEVYQTAAGAEVTLNKKQCEQRRRLVEQIESKGFEEVVEEVAYTWFNRICAIRFMEVNDYLPSRVRALSSEKEGKNEPDLVTQAPDVDLDLTDAEKEFVIESKMSGKLDELFAMLFVKQCNKLHEVLPELFEGTSDYTEMLLNISFTNKDDVVRMLIDEVPEEDFNITTEDEDGNVSGQIEIIGWLYQYYNTELKDDTFAKLKKNIKITKERIPAATQLFTPDWIVRYMVENSVGRIWIEHLRAVDSLVDEKKMAEEFGWKYYLPEAEQEEAVNQQLASIRANYKNLTPEDITCIDPCMGSGHILVAMFDVLMDIYKSAGYSERDAALLIVQKNIHGLDIDKRAYQLAYFAVMMKGRSYNRRFLRKDDERIQPLLYAFSESNLVNREHLQYFGQNLTTFEKSEAQNQINGLICEFVDAREYGSILDITNYKWDLLEKFVNSYSIEGQFSLLTVGIDETQKLLQKLVAQGKVIAKKYDIVVTNPPYMASNGMDIKLSEYVKKYYPDSKSDMFAVFIEKGMKLANKNAFIGLITQPSIVVLSSFAKLRGIINNNMTFNSLLYMGRGIFGIDFGSASFVIRKSNVKEYNAHFFKLFERTFQYIDSDIIKNMFLDSARNIEFKVDFSKIKSDSNEGELESFLHRIHFIRKQKVFEKIDKAPWVFWLSDKAMNAFDNPIKLSEIIEPKIGMVTGDTTRFLRYWYEVNYDKIGFNIKNSNEAVVSQKKWFPYQKGGNYRKWYGNLEYVINWENDGYEIKYDNYMGKRVRSHNYNGENAFMQAITYSSISSGPFSARFSDFGFLYDVAGPFCKVSDSNIYLMLGFILSKVSKLYMDAINPTINFVPGTLLSVPFFDQNQNQDDVIKINELVKENIQNELSES